MVAEIIVSPFGVRQSAFPAGTHFVTGGLKFAPLSDEHKSRIVDYLDDANEEELSRRVRKRPAFVLPASEFPFLKSIQSNEEKVGTASLLHQFALEYFSNARSPVVAFTIHGTVTSHFFDPSDLRIPDGMEPDYAAGAWERHSAYLSFLYETIHSAPLASLAVARLSRAFRQGPTADGIIDLAIALECLAMAQNEIKFQFSLYHSLVNADQVDAREVTFSLLQTLYDVRSKTVHGGTLGTSEKRKLAVVTGSWSQLVSIARANLTYHLAYCAKQGESTWQSHLRQLALGAPRFKNEG